MFVHRTIASNEPRGLKRTRAGRVCYSAVACQRAACSSARCSASEAAASPEPWRNAPLHAQIKLPHVLKTLLETAYAMRHLHNMHILHRDLKIQNVLLKSSNKDSRGFTVKVSDFGLAKIWDGRGRGNSPSEKQKYAGAQPPCPSRPRVPQPPQPLPS